MKISVNNKLIELDLKDPTLLSEFLAKQNFPDKGIAVALNGKVVRRGEWETTLLSDGDSITVIKAVCGG